MTGAQIYAFFVSPFVLLAFCLFTVWLTGWQDKREAERRTTHPSSGSSPNSSMPKPDSPT